MPGKKKAEPVLVVLFGERIGNKFKVTADHAGQQVFVDTLSLDSATARSRFVQGVADRLPKVDLGALDRDLMNLPATIPFEAEPEAEPAPEPERIQASISCMPDGTARAEVDGVTVYLHSKLDPRNPQHRRRFIANLAEKVPNLDMADVEAKLIDIGEQVIQNEAKPTPTPDEVDDLRLARPELFHTADVSGIAVPMTTMAHGKPSAEWRLYLKHLDGRRECRPLAPSLDLSGSRRLWLHPTPGEPAMNTPTGWTARSRREWLEGAATPDPAVLFREICETIAYYLDFPPETAASTTATVALWVILSYAYQLFPALPYINVGGPMGSGKSRLLDVLARLVFRALCSSNLTGAALFRTLHDRGGVLIYDEAERLRQSTPDVQELNSMLLAGYRRGGTATRLEAVGDTFRPIAFDVFGPKAIAGIAGLPPALASRCITVMMFRAGPDSPKPRRRLDEHPAKWEHLRNGLHSLALDAGSTWLELPDRADVVPSELSGRDYELWQPLLALASWVESCGAFGLLTLVQRHAITTMKASKDDAVPEADETLLELLSEAIHNSERPTPADLLSRAQARDTATFGKWGARGISNRLAVYGVKVTRANGRREYRVSMADLAKIQRHYGIDLGAPTAPTSKTAPLAALTPENLWNSWANSGAQHPASAARGASDATNGVGGEAR